MVLFLFLKDKQVQHLLLLELQINNVRKYLALVNTVLNLKKVFRLMILRISY
jgi:hypothetical protein